ncbi:hydroxyethylthiazole kinase [Bacillus benzoevorans]|uniref:Hydroxyethylthiazole kinase n=1 Tax=Bacillus benzoevorans TaxID=1456 RepID=A0A7X0LUR7_9BACI|nr:hydroxyethylthiazole kinase [Bacillus benzoevorans]MBB6445241.1 hydroxyethylthiazole kinase [Bacillus benzoevorans]
MEKGKVHTILKNIRQVNPLIYNMTAVHDASLTANGLLALGASPIIDGSVEEAAELASKAGAVILTINWSDRESFEKITTAGKAANKHGIPLILNAAGANFSLFRRQQSQQLLKRISVSAIRGDAFEIAHLIKEDRGDSGERSEAFTSNKSQLALLAAKKLSTIIVMTGREQFISDGISTYTVHNGDALLAKVSAASSLLSAIIGSCAAVEENLFEAAVSALMINGVAAEIAANKTEGQGPGNFQIEFIDQLSLLSSSEIDLYGSFAQYEKA